MKDDILKIIEEEIQKLRRELGDDIDMKGYSSQKEALICVTQINKLREIKRIINEKIK